MRCGFSNCIGLSLRGTDDDPPPETKVFREIVELAAANRPTRLRQTARTGAVTEMETMTELYQLAAMRI